MSEIRYVCLSDLHLGEEDALLTDYRGPDVPPGASQVLLDLVHCLRSTLKKCGPKAPKKPTLILNGDVLEFALAPLNQAAMAFDRFIECIMPAGDELFDTILVVPGNHDHHLWQIAQETQYLNHLTPANFPPGRPLDEPWHATNIFVENDGAVPSGLLTNLICRHDNLRNKKISIAYPNFGLFKPELHKCVLFHHGHYIESLYHLMSKLKCKVLMPGRPMPTDIWDIEAENFSWIEFFWSTMGEAEQVGAGWERAYDAIQDPNQLGNLLVNLVREQLPGHELPDLYLVDSNKLLQRFFSMIAKGVFKSEKFQDEPLSDDAHDGLAVYWNALKGQMRNEVEKRGRQLGIGDLRETLFVFGHTHKPLSWDWNDARNPIGIPIHNTGGWVVDMPEPAANHGASVVLVDENLDSASILLYKEIDDATPSPVTVQYASGMSGSPTEFFKCIERQVAQDENCWRSFAETVVDAVRKRRLKLTTPEHPMTT